MVLENAGAQAGFRFRGSGVLLSPGALVRLTAIRTFDMRKIILTLAILYPAAALAQGTAPANPPTIGGKPLVVVGKKTEAGKKEKPLSVAQKLQACQDI